MTDVVPLKRLIFKGSIYLTIRQILGLILSVISLFVIFRYLGPENYGYLAIALGIWSYITTISSFGLDVFLIREKSDYETAKVRQLYSFIVFTSIIITFFAIGFAPVLGYWIEDNNIINLFRFLALGFIIKQIGLLPQALLDKSLKYKEVSFIELLNQLTYYAVAIPLVIIGYSYWGVAIGYLISGLLSTVLLYRLNPIKITTKIDYKFVKGALKYGLGYQFSVWTWQLRDLTVPLFVSRFGGVEVVGIINATIQIVNRLSFLRMIFWRISISALAKIQDDASVLLNWIRKGASYQLILVGSILVGFGLFSPWVVNIVGQKWQKIETIFPFIALGVLTNTMFSMNCSALFVKKHNYAVNKYHVANVLLLWSSTIIFTPYFGVYGFCFGEVIALTSYLILVKQTKKYLGEIKYSDSLIILACITLMLFAASFLPIGFGILAAVLIAAAFVLLFPFIKIFYADAIKELFNYIKSKPQEKLL